MSITPKRRYRATLIPPEVPLHEAELRASQGALPFVQLLAENSGKAGLLAHHVTGLPVLSVDRFELSEAPSHHPLAQIWREEAEDLAATSLRPFRVSADWPGGGFSYTMEFADQAAALRWARHKAVAHPDAVVSAEPREVVSRQHGLLTRPCADARTEVVA